MWSIAGWIHNKHRNSLAQPTVEKAVRDHDNLVLSQTMIKRNKNVVSWDSQTTITEPEPVHGRTGCRRCVSYDVWTTTHRCIFTLKVSSNEQIPRKQACKISRKSPTRLLCRRRSKTILFKKKCKSFNGWWNQRELEHMLQLSMTMRSVINSHRTTGTSMLIIDNPPWSVILGSEQWRTANCNQKMQTVNWQSQWCHCNQQNWQQ